MREKNALWKCQSAKTIPVLNDVVTSTKYTTVNSISIQSINADESQKPKIASRQTSQVFPNHPSPNLVIYSQCHDNIKT